ncbi:fam-c protein [Plasmodium vinckei lentum]|uniref:Fam-c protein n=1 Tax=Plasmodium vinckei lentum TaxID=138297 RepID=A0A6V7S212_PLAVN|nr:fam-c protein [Plasmodium vinckei lentum]
MNKRIFSLVCIVLYVILSVSIHCSEQKASDIGNKNIRGTKEINRNSKKNDIESQQENQLNNNNSNYLTGEANFRYINSENFKKIPYRYMFCCGLCYDYRTLNNHRI